MNSKKRIGFDDMPGVMADLVEEVRTLSERVAEIGKMQAPAGTAVETSTGRIIYSTEQVCKLLHKTRGTIYRMVGRGELPGYKSGKNLMFFEDELMDWLIQSKRLTAEEMILAVEKRDSARNRRAMI